MAQERSYETVIFNQKCEFRYAVLNGTGSHFGVTKSILVKFKNWCNRQLLISKMIIKKIIWPAGCLESLIIESTAIAILTITHWVCDNLHSMYKTCHDLLWNENYFFCVFFSSLHCCILKEDKNQNDFDSSQYID